MTVGAKIDGRNRIGIWRSSPLEGISRLRSARRQKLIKLDAYREAGQRVPDMEPIARHLENPEFRDLVFACVDVSGATGRVAA